MVHIDDMSTDSIKAVLVRREKEEQDKTLEVRTVLINSDSEVVEQSFMRGSFVVIGEDCSSVAVKDEGLGYLYLVRKADWYNK